MRQLLFDEISAVDIKKINNYLKKQAESTPLHNVYWVHLPEDLWDDIQKEHKNCQPYYFAVEVGQNYIRVELLIRSRQRLHCKCIKYANESQRAFILTFVDKLIETLKIRT
ncbi:MAG: hypothetical protein LWW95_02925 [Candidatus Desulfofervidus auxilii]|nr:hypothetical protein [Candidatus Desulfofervidus auxilii]